MASLLHQCFHVPYSALTMFISTEQSERDSATAYRKSPPAHPIPLATYPEPLLSWTPLPCFFSWGPSSLLCSEVRVCETVLKQQQQKEHKPLCCSGENQRGAGTNQRSHRTRPQVQAVVASVPPTWSWSWALARPAFLPGSTGHEAPPKDLLFIAQG